MVIINIVSPAQNLVIVKPSIFHRIAVHGHLLRANLRVYHVKFHKASQSLRADFTFALWSTLHRNL